MKLSELERLSVYMLLARDGAWGGDERTILSQDEIYRGLKLSQFEKFKGDVPLNKFTGPDIRCALTGHAAITLLRMLSAPGQGHHLARHSAGAIRKIRSDAALGAAIKRAEKA